MKELSGKKSKSSIFIEADDRLDAWKSHFQNLLNAESSNTDNPDSIKKLFDVFPEINCGDFSQNEVDIALKQMKNGKAPGLDGIPIEVWKLPEIRKFLKMFCNQT